MNALKNMPLKVGGIVLCGGHSRRMGRPKADLPFGDQSLLARVTSVLAQVATPVVIVSAVGQPLPDLTAVKGDLRFAHDRRDSRGPLEGIAAGMDCIRDEVDACYVTGCDVPLLTPAFIEHIIGQLGPDDDIAVPRCKRFQHPLAAVYRTRTLPAIQRALAKDLLRPVYLFDELPTREIPVESIRAVDPDLLGLENVNTPQQYINALARCGFEER